MDETLKALSDLIDSMDKKWRYRIDPNTGSYKYENPRTPEYAMDLRYSLESALEQAIEDWRCID